jgi:hypothetical protein
VTSSKPSLLLLNIFPKEHLSFQGAEPKTYPDFAVTIYGDIIQRKEPKNRTGAARVSDSGDVTRIIIEIASTGQGEVTKASKQAVHLQLRGYMDKLGVDGERWDGKACGIAIIGTEYALQVPREDSEGNRMFTKSGKWSSIYDGKFIKMLEDYAIVENPKINKSP